MAGAEETCTVYWSRSASHRAQVLTYIEPLCMHAVCAFAVSEYVRRCVHAVCRSRVHAVCRSASGGAQIKSGGLHVDYHMLVPSHVARLTWSPASFMRLRCSSWRGTLDSHHRRNVVITVTCALPFYISAIKFASPPVSGSKHCPSLWAVPRGT